MSKAAPPLLRVRAMAKINLSLRLLGLRRDGYHELRTTLQSLALHDTLTLRPSRGPLSLTCDDPECPTDASNLVWRAAERLWRADGRKGKPAGVTIDIRKRIPMQAGLGGGSSDAASALRALAAFWGMAAGEATLRDIARRLGADVAFFLEGGTALGVGLGDVLYPLTDQPPAAVVLVHPGFGVSTRDAYAWWDATPGRENPTSKRASSRPALGRLPESGNDLEPPVVEKHPVIGRLARRLATLGATSAAMSGSGSAVFGLFPDESEALDAAAAAAGPGRVVTVTRTVNRREYARLAAFAWRSHRRRQVSRDAMCPLL
jgi:4-diphosphocytidyl-2-C-methyl-D-erythritol kinase